MLMTKGMFSSLSGDWKTPKELYAELDKEFRFDFDPCPSNPTFDGLEIQWGQRNFVNPPYGRVIGNWLAKGYAQQTLGRLSVFLLPARTDTFWFHNYCIKNEIRFIKGRIHFNRWDLVKGKWLTGPAPFPSMVVIFRP